MKTTMYLLIFYVCILPLQAQDIVQLSKSELLLAVSEKNQRIKISEEEFNLAEANFKQSNALFLPNIALSYTGFSTTNPLMAFGSKLNQEILTASDFNPTLLNNPSNIQNFATKLEIQQPLINVDGIYQRKAAKSRMEAIQLTSERTKDYLAFEVDKAYMQLQLAYKAVDVLKKALEAANNNKRLADNSFNQGYLQRADVLNIEVHVTEVENQLQAAQSNVLNASNYVSFLMNDTSFNVFLPTDSLSLNTFANKHKTITENRSDIKAMELVSDAYKNINTANKMAFLPRLNAFGSYELYDNTLLQADANGYIVGAQLSWDIFKGSKRFGNLQASKAEYEKSKLEYSQYVSESKLELNKANRMLLDAENKLKLTTLALKQSEEALRIRTNRFKEGLEKTSDLLVAESQFAQKQLEYYQTIFETNYAIAYLQFLTKE